MRILRYYVQITGRDKDREQDYEVTVLKWPVVVTVNYPGILLLSVLYGAVYAKIVFDCHVM